MMQAQPSYANLITAIENNPTWDWAKSENVLKGVKAANGSLDKFKETNAFTTLCVLSDNFPMDARKMMDAKRLEECFALLPEAKRLIKSLDEQVKVLKNMHAARKVS